MHKPAWMPFLLLTSALLVSGCAGGNSSLVIAPPLFQYGDEFQNLAADELDALGAPCPRDSVFGGCSAAKRLVMDYKWVRDKIREGRK